MTDQKDYPRPSLAADNVVVTLGAEKGLRVLFVRRARDPFAGAWALPGGFVEPNETVAEAAARELREETSLGGIEMEELGCFSKPGRDPRGWVVTVAHLALVPTDRIGDVKAGDDAAEAEWLDLVTAGGEVISLTHQGKPVGRLAFDHDEILARAVKRLFAEVVEHALRLVPPVFGVDALEAAALAIHGKPRTLRDLIDTFPVRETAPGSGQYTRKEAGA